jgi:hypothetical protein
LRDVLRLTVEFGRFVPRALLQPNACIVNRLHGPVDEFAAMTKKAVAADGFDGYLPTAIYLDRALVLVPEGPELESIAVLAIAPSLGWRWPT